MHPLIAATVTNAIAEERRAGAARARRHSRRRRFARGELRAAAPAPRPPRRYRVSGAGG